MGNALRETFPNYFMGYHCASKAAQLHFYIIRNPKQIMRERLLSLPPAPGHETGGSVGNLCELFWCLFCFEVHRIIFEHFFSYLLSPATTHHSVRTRGSTWILLWEGITCPFNLLLACLVWKLLPFSPLVTVQCLIACSCGILPNKTSLSPTWVSGYILPLWFPSLYLQNPCATQTPPASLSSSLSCLPSALSLP